MKMAGKKIKEFTCKQLRATFKKKIVVFIQSTIDQILSVC